MEYHQSLWALTNPSPEWSCSLVVELVDFLHVPKDDEFFVDDAWGDLLHPAGHFPQVGLPKKEAKEL